MTTDNDVTKPIEPDWPSFYTGAILAGLAAAIALVIKHDALQSVSASDWRCIALGVAVTVFAGLAAVKPMLDLIEALWHRPGIPDTFDRWDDDIGGAQWKGSDTARSSSVRR